MTEEQAKAFMLDLNALMERHGIGVGNYPVLLMGHYQVFNLCMRLPVPGESWGLFRTSDVERSSGL